MAMGSLVLGIVGGELASWRGPAAIAIVVTALAMVRMVAWTRKLWIANVRRKETRGIGDNAKERGQQSPARHTGMRIAWDTRGQL
jgi:hypothetical protein